MALWNIARTENIVLIKNLYNTVCTIITDITNKMQSSQNTISHTIILYIKKDQK